MNQALAQDQKASLEQLISSCEGLGHLVVATYDGDTSQGDRKSWRFTSHNALHRLIPL